MSQLSVTMTAEEADLFSKLTTLVQKTAESEAAFKKSGEASVAAANATKAAAEQTEAVARATANAAKESEAFANSGKRLADQLLRSNETLEESYQRQQNQIKSAFESGKIGAKEYENSLTVLQARHAEMQAAQAQAALEASEAYRKHNREVEAGVSTVDRLRVSNTSLEDKYKQLAIEVTKAHQAGKISADEHATAIQQLDKEYQEQKNAQEETIGSMFLGKASAAVAGWISIGAAIKAVTDSIALQNAEIQRGLDLIRQNDDPNRDLSTISDTDEELVERITQKELLQKTEGLSAEKAAGIVFALDSQGIIGDHKTLVENDRNVQLFGRVTRAADAQTMINVAGLFNKNFGIEPEVAVDMALKSSAISKFTANQLSQHLVNAATGASEFKIADQEQVAIETFALTAGLANTKDAMSGNMVKTALAKMADKFPEMTPMEAAKTVVAMDPSERKELFGDNEQVKFFISELSSRMEEFDGIVQDVSDAAEKSKSGKGRLNEIAGRRDRIDPNSILVRNSNRSKQMRDLAAQNSDESRIALSNEYYSNRRWAQITEGNGDLNFLPKWAQYSIEYMTNWDTSLNIDRGRNMDGYSEERDIRTQIESQREEAAERRHRELVDTVKPPPLITRPGDDR